MTSEVRKLLAVSLFVVGIFQGINIMISDGLSSDGLVRFVALLGGALLFWLWAMREKESGADDAQSAMENAEESIQSLDDAVKTIEDKVEAQLDQEPPKPKAEAPKAPKPKAPAPVEKKKTPSEPDDLTKIEGIGPSYRDILVQAGIDTFAKLAKMSTDQIVNTVRENGGRKHRSMETWAEQAKLAAAGDWDGLGKLQDSLSGGTKK